MGEVKNYSLERWRDLALKAIAAADDWTEDGPAWALYQLASGMTSLAKPVDNEQDLFLLSALRMNAQAFGICGVQRRGLLASSLFDQAKIALAALGDDVPPPPTRAAKARPPADVLQLRPTADEARPYWVDKD
jgi:hypothetical protein